jgi:hypothetical protein
MGSHDAFVKAFHSLTLVQRAAVFRPKPDEGASAVETQVIFITNELMHGITAQWPNSERVKLEVQRWKDGIANVAVRMSQHEKQVFSRPLEVADSSLSELIRSSRPA